MHSRTTCVGPINWSPWLVSRQRLLVFSEALICLSYSGGWLTEPKLSERRLVVPAGITPASSGYQPGALLLSQETKNMWEAFRTNASRCLCLVQECHIGHRATLGFCVHDNTMPERQRDRVMIAVANCAPSVNARVAAHHPPAPSVRIRVCAEHFPVSVSERPFGYFTQT